MIKLFNTLSGTIEPFEPLAAPEVGMYNCGPTVYSPVHIGNLSSYVFADTLRRTLEYRGYDVRQVINLTDVGHLTSDADEGEDKVEKAAREKKRNVESIIQEVSTAFFADLEKLNIDTAGSLFPRASKHIPEQIALIQTLEKKGFTYLTKDSVYFDTSKFPRYGNLGNINIHGIEEGARIGINTERRNPTDFALWKFSPAEISREQEWESPWGTGFPGWHIECSAMSMHYLGETFDIHTGGIDHIPVHHQNEIAQSEAATEKPLACYWLHNAFITIDGQKISKSLGNTLTLGDLAAQGHTPLAYRYWLLTGHYRSTTNFNQEALRGAGIALRKLYDATEACAPEVPPEEGDAEEVAIDHLEQFEQALYDDLNTPRALAAVWELVKNTEVPPQKKHATLMKMDTVLGLNLPKHPAAPVPPSIITLAEQREIARKNGMWAEADTIRKTLETEGYEISDTEHGTEIKRKMLP